jgi:hypothetical protein
MRIVLAFIVAPVAPLLLLTPVMGLLHGSIEAAGPFAFASVVYGYPAMVLCGLPLYFLFKKKLWFSWWQFTLIGALVGACVPLSLIALMTSKSVTEFASFEVIVATLTTAGVGACLGTASGFVFWAIGIRSPNTLLNRTRADDARPG